MLVRRNAFTLIEVLISISLLSLVLLALYNSVGMLRKSNAQLFQHLQSADKEKEGTETLFLDIAGSDGNITITGDEFSRLCMESTVNSLYGLPSARVCWVVSKEKHILLRSEGNGYRLPTRSDDRVEVDGVIRNIDLFRAYRKKSDLIVLLRQKNKKSISFMVQGVPEIIKKKKVKKVKRKPGARPSAGQKGPRPKGPGSRPGSQPGNQPTNRPGTQK